MATENQMQVYVDAQIEQLNPFKEMSIDLRFDAELQEVNDAASAKKALGIRKSLTAHQNKVAKARLEYTRQFDDFKKQIMKAETDTLKPAAEGQVLISKKIMDYEIQREAAENEERARIAALVASVTVAAGGLGSQDEILVQARLIENALGDMTKDDRKLSDVKLAFAQSKAELLAKADEISLGAEADEAANATANADLEDARQAAEVEAKETKRTTPKTGIKTTTKFEIIDAEKVPRIFCEPVDMLIRKAIKEGADEIAGVRIYESRGF